MKTTTTTTNPGQATTNKQTKNLGLFSFQSIIATNKKKIEWKTLFSLDIDAHTQTEKKINEKMFGISFRIK